MTKNDVLALIGGGGLFGLHSVSTLVERIEAHIPGRMVIFFPVLMVRYPGATSMASTRPLTGL